VTRYGRGTTANDTLSGDTTLVLPEFDAPAGDPLAWVGKWLERAVSRKVLEPLAATLVTVGANGNPATRVVERSARTGDEVTERVRVTRTGLCMEPSNLDSREVG
jgi:hypothetical protein